MAGNGVELATAYVSLSVEASRIAPEISKQFAQVDKDADKAGKSAGGKFSGGMGSMVKGIAGMLGGVMAGIGVKNFLGDALGEARESQKVGAITESIIRSTGGASKVTAQQVGELAAAISRKTGIDDEAVQASANLLLTFKNVKNEVGEGANVFDRATAAAQDMSAAGFGDAEGAAKMLGKALNDPIKGITALGRAGVTFTEAQKKQIEGMVESGDVLGAQKIIMAEVESQIGGAAEASATAGDKAAVAMGNLKETIGTALLPIVDKAATVFTEKIAPAIESFVTGMQDGTGAGGTFRDIIQQVIDVGTGVVDFVTKYKDILIPLAAGITAVVVAMKIWHAATVAYTAVQTALNVVMSANPIGIVILAIVALIAIIVVAYKNSETFRAIVQAAWAGIKVAVEAVVNWFRDTAWPAIKRVWESISGGASGMWDSIKDKFQKLKDGIAAVRDAFGAAKDAIAAKWSGLKDAINKPIITALSWISDNFIAPINRLLEKVGISFRIPTFSVGGSVGTSTRGGVMLAAGGRVPGYSPNDRADNIPAWLTAGEYVLPVGAVRSISSRFGGGFLEQLRRGLPGFASGGLVGDAWSWLKDKGSHAMDWAAAAASALRDPIGTLARLVSTTVPGAGPFVQAASGVLPRVVTGIVAKIKDFVAKMVPTGGTGWQSIWSAVQRVSPEARLTSTTRAGARTAGSGATSMHALGRAIDIVSGDLYGLHRKIAAAFGTSPTELIGPLKALSISRGTHKFGTVTNPTTLAGHKDHVHIAYGSGGLVKPFVADSGVTLAPGLNVLHNKLGRPEPLARTDQGGGDIHVHLEVDDLRALRTVEDFVQMVGVRSRMQAGVR